MPAAAVANLTPSIGGMSGNCAGASGDVGVDKALSPTACPGLSNRTTGLHEVRTHERRKSGAVIEEEIDNSGQFFFCSTDLSRRSILADCRSFAMNSVCALRVRK